MGFPSPKAIERERAVAVSPFVEKALAELEVKLREQGSGAVVNIPGAPHGAKEVIEKRLSDSGWRCEFGDDQRDGAWVRVWAK